MRSLPLSLLRCCSTLIVLAASVGGCAPQAGERPPRQPLADLKIDRLVATAQSRSATEAELKQLPAPDCDILSVENVRNLLRQSTRVCAFDETEPAASTLRHLGEAAFPAFHVILSAPNPESKRVVPATLWAIQHTNADRRQFLEPTLAKLADPDSEVRGAALDLLRVIGGAREAPHILPLLRDSEITVSYTAVEVLGAIGSEQEFAALAAWLNSPHRYLTDDFYRRRVIESLNAIQTRLAEKSKGL